jgi:hypothetical protein
LDLTPTELEEVRTQTIGNQTFSRTTTDLPKITINNEEGNSADAQSKNVYIDRNGMPASYSYEHYDSFMRDEYSDTTRISKPSSLSIEDLGAYLETAASRSDSTTDISYGRMVQSADPHTAFTVDNLTFVAPNKEPQSNSE